MRAKRRRHTSSEPGLTVTEGAGSLSSLFSKAPWPSQRTRRARHSIKRLSQRFFAERMSAASDTHYDVLGLSQSAKEPDIKRSFRRLALVHHPDRPGGNADLFKRAVEAYEVLTDRQKRAAYDSSIAGSSWRKSAAQSAANAAANGTFRKRPRSDFAWSFFSPRHSAASDAGPTSDDFAAAFGPRYGSARSSRKWPFFFPSSFGFDSFDFPDPPFAREERNEPPPRRPRSSRYEQMRAEQRPFSEDTTPDENEFESSGTSQDSWMDHAETQRRQAEAERRRAETERRRAETERKLAESERRRAKSERVKAEMMRMRAKAEQREQVAILRAQLAQAREQVETQDRHSAEGHSQFRPRFQPQSQGETETLYHAANGSAHKQSNIDTNEFSEKQTANAPREAAAGPVETDSSTSGQHTGSRRRQRRRDGDLRSGWDSEPEPEAKRARLDPEIVDLTADDTPVSSGKRKHPSPDSLFDMSDMRRVPPFTERDGASFNLNGMQSAVPSREEVRLRQQNRSYSVPTEQLKLQEARASESKLWSEYVHGSYNIYDRLFKLHNERNELVDRGGNANREAVIANLRETAQWLNVLLQGTQKCIPSDSQ